MTRVRLTNTQHDGEHELVDFMERWPSERNQAYVLRDDSGNVVTLDHFSVHDGVALLEVRCDYCGQWVDHAGPAPGGGWRCYGGYGAEGCADEEDTAHPHPAGG